MNRKNIISLYDKYKNSPKKLKIICDWDEVIQACEPYAYWLAKEKQEGKEKFPNFSITFESFWEEEEIINYSPYGSKLLISSGTLEKQQQIKNSPDFYQQAPFLTIAEDLLRLIKEDKVEELAFMTANDDRIFPDGDIRKKKIFVETFGKLGKYLGSLEIRLVPFGMEGKEQTKADLIKKKFSDFDIVIDDNPNICKSLVEELIIYCSHCIFNHMGRGSGNPYPPNLAPCDNCPRIKMTVFAPYYPSTENQHHPEVLLVKNEVSNLKKEDFSK